jgi:protein TonB
MLRIITALVLGVAVTFGLFLLMQSLIELGKVELEETRTVKVADFIRLKRSSKAITKKRELPKKQEIKAQPAPPSLKLPQVEAGTTARAIKISVPAPSEARKVKLSGGPHLSSAPSDAGSIPLVRIQPMYPRSAAEKRIEGWVLLEFTITITGAVKKAKVIASDPPRIFDSAALKAIRKWKYKPKIVNGVPVETRGVQVKLSFRLEDLR